MSEAAKKKVPPRVQSGCLVHGGFYYKDLTGCFAGEPEETLQERKVELEREWLLLTGSPPPNGSRQPIHVQVEYLGAILDFELHPPCGCDPPGIPEGFHEEDR